MTDALTVAALVGFTTYTVGCLILGAVRLSVRLAILRRRWHRSEPDPESVLAMAARVQAQVEYDSNRPAVTQDAWEDPDKTKRIS